MSRGGCGRTCCHLETSYPRYGCIKRVGGYVGLVTTV